MAKRYKDYTKQRRMTQLRRHVTNRVTTLQTKWNSLTAQGTRGAGTIPTPTIPTATIPTSVIIVCLLSAYWRSPAPRSTCAQAGLGLGLVTQVRVGMVLVGIVRVGMVTCTRLDQEQISAWFHHAASLWMDPRHHHNYHRHHCPYFFFFFSYACHLP